LFNAFAMVDGRPFDMRELFAMMEAVEVPEEA
jgi:hypothetical protein